MREHAPERAVAELLAHAAAARGGGGDAAAGASRAARLAWRRSPSASRHVSRAVPRQQRQADPQRREQHAEHEPAADHEQVRQALAEPDDQVQQRAPRGAQVRREVQRGGHDAASTVTSPLVLSAWIWNGASSASVEPADADVARVALRVDLVAAGGHDGAARRRCASAARAGRPSTPRRRRRRRSPSSRAARSRRSRSAAIAPEPVLTCTEARTPARLHGAARRSRSRAGRCRARPAGRTRGRSRAPGPGSAR